MCLFCGTLNQTKTKRKRETKVVCSTTVNGLQITTQIENDKIIESNNKSNSSAFEMLLVRQKESDRNIACDCVSFFQIACYLQ